MASITASFAGADDEVSTADSNAAAAVIDRGVGYDLSEWNPAHLRAEGIWQRVAPMDNKLISQKTTTDT